MITQTEFVEGCLNYYAENFYEQGNPEDGVWERAHYPIPKCLGGEETILLLREHHAIQGILQSEEVNHPCLYGWEKHYLPVEMLPLYHKWCSVKTRLGNKNRSPEAWNHLRASCSSEVMSTLAKRGWETKTEEEINSYRERMRSLAHLGRAKQAKPVEVIYANGEKSTHPSISEAAQDLGMNRQNVSTLVKTGAGNKKRNIISIQFI